MNPYGFCVCCASSEVLTGEVALSAIRLAVTVVSAAVTMSRHPVVRAGIQAVANNPRAREAAVSATRNAAYSAGVIARHIVGRRTP
jgi:hypothetical protein